MQKKFWKIRIFDRETKRFSDRVSRKKNFSKSKFLIFERDKTSILTPVCYTCLIKCGDHVVARHGALEQNERKPKNGSRAPPSQPILMTFTLNDRKMF